VTEEVLLEKRHQIAVLTLNRPDRANTINGALISKLQAGALSAANDPEVRVLVITGAGKHFCGGADLRDPSRKPGAPRPVALPGPALSLDWVPKPVIAAINGACMGAGLEVAASCDIRIAADNARFAMPEVLFDLPSVVEAALFPRLIGWGRACWLLYRGDAIDAATALDWGLVEKTVPAAELDAAVAETVDVIMANGPTGMRLQKQLMRAWESQSLDDGIKAGIESLAAAYRDGDPGARMAAFLDKN